MDLGNILKILFTQARDRSRAKKSEEIARRFQEILTYIEMAITLGGERAQEEIRNFVSDTFLNLKLVQAIREEDAEKCHETFESLYETLRIKIEEKAATATAAREHVDTEKLQIELDLIETLKCLDVQFLAQVMPWKTMHAMFKHFDIDTATSDDKTERVHAFNIRFFDFFIDLATAFTLPSSEVTDGMAIQQCELALMKTPTLFYEYFRNFMLAATETAAAPQVQQGQESMNVFAGSVVNVEGDEPPQFLLDLPLFGNVLLFKQLWGQQVKENEANRKFLSEELRALLMDAAGLSSLQNLMSSNFLEDVANRVTTFLESNPVNVQEGEDVPMAQVMSAAMSIFESMQTDGSLDSLVAGTNAHNIDEEMLTRMIENMRGSMPPELSNLLDDYSNVLETQSKPVFD